MAPRSTISNWRRPALSELILSDRLIALAKVADRAGYTETAEELLTLACSVFDEAPKNAAKYIR